MGGILKPASNKLAFLKAGFFGFQGSGKTFTAMDLAIGLTKRLGGTKIAGMDTEGGFNFLIPRVKEAGLQLDVVNSRAFTDLVTVVKEAAGNYSALVIDSITHPWLELMDSYLRSKRRTYISLPDWKVLKGQWSEFTDLFINSPIHIIICGRAAHDYADFENEDTNKMESRIVGEKMRTESEFGYEPNLVVYMERVSEGKISKGKKKSNLWIHRAIILKDKANLLHGKVFDNPTYKDFEPHINFLNLGGGHLSVDTSRNSSELFKDENTQGFEAKQRIREATLEEIQIELKKLDLDGTKKETQKKRIEVLEDMFGTANGAKIRVMKLKELELGLSKLRLLREGMQNGRNENK